MKDQTNLIELRRAQKKSFEIKSGPKQECREILCEEAQNYLGKDPKNIFTLPGREILCVKTFRKHFPKALVKGVERDAEIFEEICSKGVNCLNTDVRTFSNANTIPTNHFDIVFLDYYSFLGRNILEDIRTFLSNENIVHKGKPFVFGLTLMKAVRRDAEDVANFMKDNIYNGHKESVENTIKFTGDAIKNFLSCELEGIQSIRMVRQMEYQARAGSTPMYFFCFTVTM